MNGSQSFAVTTHGLSMRYGKQTALDAVDLRVPDGAIYVLIGANGAGKSSAMKVLLNLERVDAGRAIHSGKQLLKFVSDKRPLYAGVDPYNFYIDRDSEDNVADVATP